MTPLEALRAATGWAAECIGRGEDLGTVEKGKLADLVVVKGDPLADVDDPAAARPDRARDQGRRNRRGTACAASRGGTESLSSELIVIHLGG